jgi:hypothetical protein
MRKSRRRFVVAKPRHPHGMTTEQYRFATEYLANGGNASQAYRAGHPKAKSGTCDAEGWAYLRIPKVRAYVTEWIEAALARRKADGDVMIGLVVGDATYDLREIHDASGAMLPIAQWPTHIAQSLEGFDVRPDGTVRVRMVSKAASRKLLLEMTGKAKTGAESIADLLAAALTKDMGPR